MTANLFDTFEVWLQGRINLCVTGLVSRLETQEKAMREQCDLNITLLDRIKKLEDGERPNDERLYAEVNSYMKDGGGQTLVDGLVAAALANNPAAERATRAICSEYWDNWLNHNNLTDYIEGRDIWNMIEDDVDTAIDDKGVGLSDEDLEEKIKDVVRDNLTFEVTVS